MNGRLRSKSGESIAPPARSSSLGKRSRSGHFSRGSILDQWGRDREQTPQSDRPLSSQQGDEDLDRPESSAQGAARYSATFPRTDRMQDVPSRDSPAQDSTATDYVADTFGRSSGTSAINDSESRQGSSVRTRKTSPTERSAFGYLSTKWFSPGSATNPNINEYLRQGQRQQGIDTSSTSPNREELDTSPIAEASEMRAGTSLSRDAGLLLPHSNESSTQTFGRLSQDKGANAAHSSDSGPEHLASQASRSGTTSSRDTTQSRPGYGVGEAGGDEGLNVPARTLSPDQLRQREELRRMNEQQPVATSTAEQDAKRLSSPLALQASNRASQHSATTVTGVTASAGSSSTPVQGSRWSRQTDSANAASSASVTRKSQRLSVARGMFAGDDGSGESRESLNNGLDREGSDRSAKEAALTRSASVRAKTPIFGTTHETLPVGQRASLIEHSNHPTPPIATDPHGFADGNPAVDDDAARTRFDSGGSGAFVLGHRARNFSLPTANGTLNEATFHNLQLDSEQAKRRDLQQRQQEELYHTHAGPTPGPGDQPDPLTGLYKAAPKFPSPPHSQYTSLHLRSRLAKMHHAVLPLLTYASIPATLFLDYNVVFSLVQVALHPDSNTSGVRTAWWLATSIYIVAILAWLLGVVVLYEWLWQYKRRWTVRQPLILPIYLSSTAFIRTAMRDYSLYSLLYRVRQTADRRDAYIESFWYYSQNWPTVLTLVPRGIISAILLVLYRPAGPILNTSSPRDVGYFDQMTQRLNQYAFVVVTIQAAWVAWKLGLLIAANLGLITTIGWTALLEREQDRNALGSHEMGSAIDYSRRGLAPRPCRDASYFEGDDDLDHAISRRWAWRWRAEDRIRATLFDAGVMDGPHMRQSMPAEQQHLVDRYRRSYEAEGTTDSVQIPMFEPVATQGDDQNWFGSDLVVSQSQTGLAITAPEAIQTSTLPSAPATLTSMPQTLHLAHVESSSEDERSEASDPYSPAPEPIGRSPRSKEQLRDAASITSRNDRASLRAGSISSINRLMAITGTSQAAGAGLSPSTSSPRQADEYGVLPTHGSHDSKMVSSLYASVEGGGMFSPAHSAGVPTEDDAPARRRGDASRMEDAQDPGLLEEPRGKKRPRSSPIGLPVFGLTSTDTDANGEDDRANPSNRTKFEPSDDDQQIMRTMVPFPSVSMVPAPSSIGSPGAEPGGSDTKHGSWTAAAPNPELFAGKGSAPATPPTRTPEVKNSSLTSLASSLKGPRSGAPSRPRSGHEASSEDSGSMEGGDAKKKGRNSLLGMITTSNSAGAGRDGESWITSLFGRGSSSRKVSAATVQGQSGRGDSNEMLSSSLPSANGLPMVVTTSTSTITPFEYQRNHPVDPTQEPIEELQPVKADSTLLAVESGGDRATSPANSHVSNDSTGTDDSDERRLWASFPEQSRRHPPGLIALDLEQQRLAERQQQAAYQMNNMDTSLWQQTSAYGAVPLTTSPTLLPGALPAVSAIGGGVSSFPHLALLGAGMNELSVSPSEGGLHAIREESWSSSLDSRSASSAQGDGSTGGSRSRGPASASPTQATFDLEDLDVNNPAAPRIIVRRDST